MNRRPESVTLFVTCLGDTFYPGAVAAARRVLERAGWRVRCPRDQTCCGQPMFNAGYREPARQTARHFLDVFRATDGPIVAPSSSCAAMVRRHYPQLFADEPETLEAALETGRRTYELSEFLVRVANLDLPALGARFAQSVTFHRSCHFRGLEREEDPVELIRRIPGIDYRPLSRIEECCGFGGTFSLNFPQISRAMAAEKVRCIRATGADWLITADAGCGMNITGYARREGIPIRMMHMAELLDAALREGAA
ncbi:MAG: Fe-S oxidoreductase [Candidatus Eisenbacteria bacterium]|nr:Fe-S oxidoreductase [Candidatus Eisenbacteria bacterium]